jgi:AraC-like DNA-binding protein
MWITPARVFYHGLLGEPSLRSMGSVTVYVAVSGHIRIQMDGGEWQTTELAVVPPYVPHQVCADSRFITLMQFEAESVRLPALPAWLQARGAVDAPEQVQALREKQLQLSQWAACVDLDTLDFDQTLLGSALPSKPMDARIAMVLRHLQQDPAASLLAQDYAAMAHLSFSRFLHLFKQEVGAPFRSFRTWKRARNVLHHVVRQDANLLDVALDAGYPDSTHFSHSIRQIYGLKPSDMFAGSRRLRVHAQTASLTGA